MGAYRSNPIIEKVSESGEYCTGKRKVIYGATAMQGWRMAMEDAHCIIPDFDGGSSLFGVYDGHGGKEVAVYCAIHLGDLIKSTTAYSEGNLAQAMKDAFMQCDRLLKEKEAIEELKKYDEDAIPAEELDHDSKEDLAGLLEESSMPLQDLLARYNAPVLLEAAQDKGNSGHVKRGGLSSILQLLTSNSDLDSEESDYESANSSDESDEDTKSPTSSTAGSPATQLAPDSSNALTDTTQSPASSRQEDIPPAVDRSSEADLTAVQPDHTSLQSIHDSIQAEPNTEIKKTSTNTSEGRIGPSPKINRLESRSLMELLTAKPDTPNMDDTRFLSPTRKRLHPVDDASMDTRKKSPSKAMDKQGYHSGTTAVVGVLRDSEFIVANAGDSKCVLACRGKAVDMSFDHKPTDQIELDRITKAGGKVGADSRVNGGLNLSRAIGDHFYKTNPSLSLEDQMISAMPDIKSVPVNDEDQDFIVFACDGIWNSKTSQEVVDFVCYRIKEKVGHGVPTQQHLTQICESLCDACLAGDTNNDGTGCDNMTCILIYLSKDT